MLHIVAGLARHKDKNRARPLIFVYYVWGHKAMAITWVLLAFLSGGHSVWYAFWSERHEFFRTFFFSSGISVRFEQLTSLTQWIQLYFITRHDYCMLKGRWKVRNIILLPGVAQWVIEMGLSLLIESIWSGSGNEWWCSVSTTMWCAVS